MMELTTRDRRARAGRLFAGAVLLLFFGPACAEKKDHVSAASDGGPDRGSVSPAVSPDEEVDISARARARPFASPEEGAGALVAALKPLNKPELHAILGPDAE